MVHCSASLLTKELPPATHAPECEVLIPFQLQHPLDNLKELLILQLTPLETRAIDECDHSPPAHQHRSVNQLHPWQLSRKCERYSGLRSDEVQHQQDNVI